MSDTDSTATAEDIAVLESPENQVPDLALPPNEPNFLFGSLGVILVGPEEFRFDIHKDIFSRASPFFKAAFNGNFEESNGTIRLPEQEVLTVAFFVRWVYTRRLRGFYYPDTREPSLSQIEGELWREARKRRARKPDRLVWDNPVRKRWDLARYHDTPLLELVRLYILADVLQVPGLQDHVVSMITDIYFPTDSLSAFWQQGDDRVAGLESPVESINLAWAFTPAQSNLRRVLLIIVCSLAPNISKPPFDDTIDPEFVKEAFNQLAHWYGELRKDFENVEDTSLQWNVCRFHKHDAGCPKNPDFPIYD